jgi:glycosyltransferase involved in cell wall biosynthesis
MSKIRVLYYMPVAYSTLQDRLSWVKEHKFRGELMYCIMDTEKYGCTVWAPETKRYGVASKKLNLYYTWQLIKTAKQYDVIYSPYYQGLEWLIYLKAVGLFRKKIVVWHHNPIEDVPKKFLSRLKRKLFFRGCDALLFFTKTLRGLSLNKGCPYDKMFVVDWGPDMEYFDNIRLKYSTCKGNYLMSGSDSRDFESAIDAFSKESAISFDVYPPSDKLYEKYRSRYDNIQVFKLEHNNVGYEKVAKATADCKAVIIITKPVPGRKLPSGLTSICEAVALGKPCIITDNPYFSDEMRHAGFAKFVKVGDVEGIRKAIVELEENPELRLQMSEVALAYARKYSSENTAKQLVEIFKNVLKK